MWPDVMSLLNAVAVAVVVAVAVAVWRRGIHHTAVRHRQPISQSMPPRRSQCPLTDI